MLLIVSNQVARLTLLTVEPGNQTACPNVFPLLSVVMAPQNVPLKMMRKTALYLVSTLVIPQPLWWRTWLCSCLSVHPSVRPSFRPSICSFVCHQTCVMRNSRCTCKSLNYVAMKVSMNICQHIYCTLEYFDSHLFEINRAFRPGLNIFL